MNPTIQVLLRAIQGENLSASSFPRWLKRPDDPRSCKFWKFAEIHGLDFIIYHRMAASKTWARSVPADCQTAARENLLNNLELVAWLERFHEQARDLNLRVFCFKGPALAAMAYDGLGCRGAGDIDLFVDSSDVNPAARLLCSLGFKSIDTLRGRDYREFHFHVPFVHPDGIEVELHWAISRKSCRVNFEMDRLWARRVGLQLHGRTVDGLSPEDHLLILCVHGTRHLWERLIWLHDIAALLRREEALDWGYVVEESRRLGCFRMLLLALYLTDHLLKEPVPTRLLREAYGEPTILAAARRIVAGYDESEPDLGAFQRDWACFSLRERLVDKLTFLRSFPLAEYCDLWAEQVDEERGFPGGFRLNATRSWVLGRLKRGILRLAGRPR